ncbi:hypothetical protein FQR65_LT19025 [Abscondita terminalis]|nr:hypothetical protein FQR65_LT19025 [Abscondita terminalis]
MPRWASRIRLEVTWRARGAHCRTSARPTPPPRRHAHSPTRCDHVPPLVCADIGRKRPTGPTARVSLAMAGHQRPNSWTQTPWGLGYEFSRAQPQQTQGADPVTTAPKQHPKRSAWLRPWRVLASRFPPRHLFAVRAMGAFQELRACRRKRAPARLVQQAGMDALGPASENSILSTPCRRGMPGGLDWFPQRLAGDSSPADPVSAASAPGQADFRCPGRRPEELAVQFCQEIAGDARAKRRLPDPAPVEKPRRSTKGRGGRCPVCPLTTQRLSEPEAAQAAAARPLADKCEAWLAGPAAHRTSWTHSRAGYRAEGSRGGFVMNYAEIITRLERQAAA